MADNSMAELSANREKVIVKISIISIITNVFFAVFKAAIGMISHSIAVTLDAVNNLSDALSSVVTIIGAKLGSKQSNKKHPLSFGSVRQELPNTMMVDNVDKLTRRMQAKVYWKTGVTCIGVYSYNASDNKTAKIRNTVQETVLTHDWALQLHGFYADTENKIMRFDVILRFDIERNETLKRFLTTHAIMQAQFDRSYPDLTEKVYVN